MRARRLAFLELLTEPKYHYLPVCFPPSHGDEVCCSRRENLRVDSQSIDVVIPGGQGEEHPGPQRLVVEPGGVLVNVSVGAQQYRHPLSKSSLLGADDANILD